MNVLLSSLIRARGFLPGRQTERDSGRPAPVQHDVLLHILRKNAHTEYGKRYGFSELRGAKDFAAQVPVVEYGDIEADVERIKQGRTNILTAEPTIMFSLTSGTSANPKFIPITRSGQNRTKQLMTQWFCRALRDHPALFDKGVFDITGAAIEGYCECGIPYGSASGMIHTTLPRIMKSTFCTPPEAPEIADYELRYYALARAAYAKELSFIGTPNPLTLTKFAETGARHAESIVRCVHNGWFSESIKNECDYTSNGVPLSLKPVMRPDRNRAGFLAKILAETGALKPRDCWPDLALIGCWLGGSIGFHAGALTEAYGNIPQRDLGYMASEGSITLPVADATSAGFLALRNHYYEFIPLSENGTRSPVALGAHELESGRCYKILLTNENGLYRYDINDIVRAEGFYNRAPVISFVRKSGAMTNIAGEKLHLNHLLLAIRSLHSRFALEIRLFRAAPDISAQRYEVFLDIQRELSEAFLRDTVLPALDDSLCGCNIEYAAKRKSGRLHPPRIHLMNADWEHAARSEHASFSKRDTQYKWLPLIPEKTAVDERCIRLTIEPRISTQPN
ncbi:MAG: GH3 auxin-responsive promoter family protein, partial [Kiritimatiellales bacterium]